MCKVVFSDIDGTLLDDDHQLTPLNELGIKELIKNDISFVMVSGRSLPSIRLISDAYKYKCPAICFGGCLIYDENNNVLFNKGINKNIAKEMIDYLLGKYPLTYCIYVLDKWYTPNRSNPHIIREEKIVKSTAIEGSFDDIKSSEINKVLLICKKEECQLINDDLIHKYPDYSFVMSSDTQVEIMPSGTSKGSAVKKYCEIFGIDLKETISFGDHFNDKSMLEITGDYFLMDNAPKTLKEKFPHKCKSNNESGFYFALKSLHLIK